MFISRFVGITKSKWFGLKKQYIVKDLETKERFIVVNEDEQKRLMDYLDELIQIERE